MAFADDVNRALLDTTPYLVDYAKAMGAFVIRFSGDKLAHVGKAVDAALDRVLATSKRPVTFRGWLPKGAKSIRYATPRPTTGAGRKLLTTSLATLKKMPKDRSKVYFTDGKPEGLVPEDFSAYFSLSKDANNSFATGKGFFACAFPMASLTDPKYTALVEELVMLLGAEVASMGPAVWLAPHNLFNNSLNQIENAKQCIALWGRFPHVDVPSLQASRWPFDFDEYKPSALDGFLVPTWRMWLGKKRFDIDVSPFEMNDAIYETWKAWWAELSQLHVTNSAENRVAPYYRDRFAAKSFSELLPAWQAAHEAKQAQVAREGEITRTISKLAESPTKQLLEYAEGIAKEMTLSHAWHFLPGLRALLDAGGAKPEEATVWLDICEQLGDTKIFPKAAAVAAAAGEQDRAIDLLRRAVKAGHVDPKHLVRDPDFKPLRKHAQWKKLTLG